MVLLFVQDYYRIALWQQHGKHGKPIWIFHRIIILTFFQNEALSGPVLVSFVNKIQDFEIKILRHSRSKRRSERTAEENL